MWEERGRSAEIGGTQFHSLANHRGVLPLSSWLKKSTGSSRTSSSSSGRPSPHIQTSGSSKNYWEANWSRPCMDAAHWHQGLGLLKPMEEMLMGSTTTAGANQQQVQGSNLNLPLQPPSSSSSAPGACGGAMGLAGAVVAGVGSSGGAGVERKARPQKEKALNCPRCNSTNTKFCYYNNYSLQQPRYFCKTCRRYWTEGGSLRNVPVGGGSRKNKRSSSSSSSANAAAAAASASVMASSTSMSMASKNPKLAHEGGGAQHDLNLAFPHHVAHGGMQQQADQYMAFPSLESSSIGGGAMASGNNNGRHGALSAMELLRSTGCYMPSLHVPMQMPAPGEYGAAGFSLGEFRAAPGPPQPQSQGLLGFSLDAHGGPVASAMQGMPPHQDRAGRMLFPFEDLKPTDASGSSGGGGGDESGAGAGGENGGHRYEQAGSKEQGNGHAGGHDTAPGFWNGMIGGGTSW